MILDLRELKNIYAGRDAWVIASGPSAGYIDPGFFDGKLTIGVNRVWSRFKTEYLVIKEAAVLADAIATGARVVASHFDCGNRSRQKNTAIGDFYRFEHADIDILSVPLAELGRDRLVVSYSSITSAIHLAAYMGAKNIMLVGHDCGTLDGERNFDGYPDPIVTAAGFYEGFLRKIEPQTLRLREGLAAVYGCRIYSLNPFLNFGLEGAIYER